jgi:peptidoglycan/LPS O-acetylase OafA/YrhL
LTESDTLVRTQVTPKAGATRFLANVQAARAVAVLLVVAFHLWPNAVPGGFDGVDVFFVISGFLITGHLAREFASAGKISLPAFYARRVRRLFPAALTVMLACAAGVVALLPMNAWPRNFQEIMASALYFENWSLASSSVDYFAAEDPPTVVQHFWSLSVEEQFYLVWPLLFLLTAVLARWLPQRRRILIALGPAVVLVLSYLFSVRVTGATPGSEYFSTFARAWEFAAGGLLALSGISGRLKGGWAAIVSWAGWATIIGSGFLLSATMRFPGWIAAVPVLGTVAVIAAGTPSGGAGADRTSRVISNRVVQFIGGISYSLYLWHWPVVIFFGRIPGSVEDSDVNRFLLLGISLLLAIASTYLIEAPIRRLGARSDRPAPTEPAPDPVGPVGPVGPDQPPNRPARARRPRTGLTLGLGAVGMAVICVVCLGGQSSVKHTQDQAMQRVSTVRESPPACFGAVALDPKQPACRNINTGTPVPSPVAAFDDKPRTCMQAIDKAALRVCGSGPSAAKAKRQIAVIGDSHAMHWVPALQLLAKQQQWHVTTLLKGSCPLTHAVRVMSRAEAASCVAWNEAVQRWLVEHPQVDEIFVSSSSLNAVVPAPGQTWQQTAIQGYLSAWDALPHSVKHIFVLRDIPRPRPDVVACGQLAVQKGQDLRECGRPAAQAILDDMEARAAAKSDRVPVVLDLNQYFCADGYCSPDVGGAFVYRDGHHMTATFARSLAPYVLAQSEAAQSKTAS